MREPVGVLLGAGIGAVLMYLLDPERGHRRRARIRDQAIHSGHLVARGLDRSARDLQNRVVGTLATARSAVVDRHPDDVVLTERVRARLGRASTHPGSIEVSTHNGVVTLAGPILAHEVTEVMKAASSVRGVMRVENRLEVHREAGRIPGLQGQPPRRGGDDFVFMQANWPPALRALAIVVGAIGAAYAALRRDLLGMAAGMTGSLLLLRAATNLEFARLTGVGAHRRAIDVQKTIHFKAPVDRVFEVWANFELFPTFMRHVRQVRRVEDGRQREHWRWSVDGPAGTHVEFDTTVTRMEPERIIRWRSVPGNLIQNAGTIRFLQEGEGTRVDIHMTYNPVAGALGHAVAWLFSADPKHQMDDDLMRMKSYIETGKLPHDAAQRRGNGQAAMPSMVRRSLSSAPQPEEPAPQREASAAVPMM